MLKKPSSLQGSLSWVASLSSLPLKPGVYWFQDQKNKVIYVGKAKNLRSRVSSYRLVSDKNRKTQKLIQNIVKVKFKELDTEIDALIIEAQLIKIHQPKYNIRLKDDKTPAFIYITKDKYPKVKVARINQIPENVSQKNIFGPYSSSYSARKIVTYTRKIIPFCNAKDFDIENQKPCFYYHIDLCPGICVGKIEISKYLQNVHKISLFLRGKKRKVISDLKSEISVFTRQKKFELAQASKLQIEALQHKSSFINIDKNLPILSDDKSDESLKIVRHILRKFFSLPSDYPLFRLEGYDISNTQGTNATGSMVVFTNGEKDTNEYKKFKIKTKETPDDPYMIGEILKRRSAHDEWGIPNLIVIDGGKTQLSAAISNTKWNIPIVSVVKNPDRIMIKKDKKYYTVPLSNDLGSNLLRRIRDESHRFAKNYHKILRSKRLIQNN